MTLCAECWRFRSCTLAYGFLRAIVCAGAVGVTSSCIVFFAFIYDKFLFLLVPLLSAFSQSSLAFFAATAKIFVIRRVCFALNLILNFKSDTSDIGRFQLACCHIIAKFFY